MKKLISLLLVLALSLSLCCTAFAVASPGGEVPTEPGSETPGTGDPANLMLWIVLLVAALVAIIVLTLCFRKYLKR